MNTGACARGHCPAPTEFLEALQIINFLEKSQTLKYIYILLEEQNHIRPDFLVGTHKKLEGDPQIFLFL